ncbi:hypothetical protein [Nonomuraea jabiensis]|uniref:Uncharacterized protein n=1 Tax=Nonomuraea jabiensis TaxID=882448 RepID=A0A7W9FYG9_9ACTN|nr:hypothetical protein [Nonomuraea jabiensis]MBB5773897.1 hypothetical protein [Nonomuraea jabiensis]
MSIRREQPVNIAELARVRDEELAGDPVGQASGAGARALMESIMAEERVPARRRSSRGGRWLGLATVAVAASVVLAVGVPFGGPVTEYANAAVSVKAGDDYLEVAINDPEAEAAEFTEAFRAVGLDAVVKKAPVAPEDVGELVGPIVDGEFPPGLGMTSSRKEDCASAWCGTVSIPIHSKGKIIFGIGRPAAPGERYATQGQISPPSDGGDVDGYEAHGKRVAEVRADMERLGLKITYVVMWTTGPEGVGEGYEVDDAYVKDDWTVAFAMKTASDAVQLTVEAGPGVPLNSLPKGAPLEISDWWKD